MLKILVAMPHYYKSDPTSSHGYGRDTPKQRAATASLCIRTLLSTFSVPRKHVVVDVVDGKPIYRRVPADGWNAIQMDIALCTTEGDENVIPLFKVPEIHEIWNMAVCNICGCMKGIMTIIAL